MGSGADMTGSTAHPPMRNTRKHQPEQASLETMTAPMGSAFLWTVPNSNREGAKWGWTCWLHSPAHAMKCLRNNRVHGPFPLGAPKVVHPKHVSSMVLSTIFDNVLTSHPCHLFSSFPERQFMFPDGLAHSKQARSKQEASKA